MNVGDLIPIGAVGNAQKADVLAGKTFSSETEGVEVIGTMPDNGVKTITPSTTDQALNGFYASGSKVVGDADLIAKNIAEGKNIFGVTGTHTGQGFKASDTVRCSATKLVKFYGKSGVSFRLAKKFKITKTGSVRLTFYLEGMYADAQARIKLNGNEIYFDSADYQGQTITHDITIDTPNSILEIWVRLHTTNSDYWGELKNAYLKYDYVNQGSGDSTVLLDSSGEI